MTDKKIFIGWSGKTGKKLAEAFRTTLGDYPGLDCKMSPDLKTGREWFDGLKEFLDEADYYIGFVSPGVYRKIWFNFEAGYIYHKLGKSPLILLGDEENLLRSEDPIPLWYFQSKSGRNKEEMIGLMKEMIDGNVREKFLDDGFEQWLKIYNELEEQLDWELKIESTVEPLLRSVSKLKYDKKLKNNDSLKLIITESINELGEEIKKIEKSHSFSAPASQWSHNLVKLKEKFGEKLKLKAVSIIDQQDTFWLQDIGREIAKSSKPETDERIFVFTSEADLTRYFDMIKEHAKQYKVRVTTMQALKFSFQEYAKDLGILYTDDSQLLALYDRTESQKKIKYIMSPTETEKHKKAFEEIKKISEEIPKDDSRSFSDIKELLFEGLEAFPIRFVEMSVYTSVLDYHNHSEKHPYYEEMSKEMIRVFDEHRTNKAEKCKILEFGAGAGNFTEKLAKISNADVLAFEIDWAYFNIASYRLSKYDHVKLEYADARKVDPEGPDVKYKYIFSCFLDHHMKVTDKVNDKIKYLLNVRKNLEKGGLFIVGDSFLRDFTEDEEDRKNAILDYHNHIIEITKNKAKTAEFARMEKKLLDDKLDKEKEYVDDYKVSLKQYEEYLHKAGLKVKGDPVKIGPTDVENVGGVYVYTIELA